MLSNSLCLRAPERGCTPGQECKHTGCLHRWDEATDTAEVNHDRGGSGPWRLRIHSHWARSFFVFCCHPTKAMSLMSSAVTQTHLTEENKAPGSTQLQCSSTQPPLCTSTDLLAPCRHTQQLGQVYRGVELSSDKAALDWRELEHSPAGPGLLISFIH